MTKVNNLQNQKVGYNTRITHKRGKYNEKILSKLKDGEIFYDVTGEHGIFIGQENKDGEVEVICLATPGGGISPEEWELVVKKTDIVRKLDEGVIYDADAVLAANAGRSLKAEINGNKTRIERLEELFETELEKTVAQKVAEVFNKMSGSDSIDIKTNPTTGAPTISVKSNSTLESDSNGLGSVWISYNK